MPSSRLTFLVPPQGVNHGYWEAFVTEMLARLGGAYAHVAVHAAYPDSSRGSSGDEIVVAVAPSRETPPPPTRLLWIPRMGEPVVRANPWSRADLIMLPLGAGNVDSTLPVAHLGAGLPRRADVRGAQARDAGEAPRPVVVKPDGDDRFSPFLMALADGDIPIVDASDPLLSYMCERWSVGIPCSGEDEREAACGHLTRNPAVAARMNRAGRQFARRILSWRRTFQRLLAGIRAVEMPAPSVHTIVLNWNGRALLPDCLESLRLQDYPRQVPVMVDNGSGDGSVEFVASVFPECRVVTNRKNLGFAEGNNVGMRAALRDGADYVVLLNNDTRVARGWLRALIDAAESDRTIGVAGSCMLFYDRPRIINSAGGMMNQALYGWDRGVFEHEGRRWRTPHDCLAVTGGAMLVRVAALRRAGVFDRAYFAYYEDNDLCHRIRLDGWRVCYVPASRVFHKLSATSGSMSDWKTFLLERSRYRYVMKNVPLGYLARHGGRLLSQEWSELRSWWRAREYRRVMIQLRAAFAAAGRMPDILWWRLFRGSGRDTRWVDALAEGFTRPSFPRREDQFADIYEGMTPEGRVILTCSSRGLRGDWSPVHPSFPRFRWLQGKGTVLVGNHRIDEGYIQAHVFVPPERTSSELIISCPPDGARTVALPHPGWHTLVVPVSNVPARSWVELVAPAPVGINEVSLLPCDSPLLRAS